MAAAVIGDLAFFAGGYLDAQTTVTDIVDIYNFITKTWSTATLSQARAFLTAVSLGDIVLFAGGTDVNNESSNRVDIYHASDGTWTIDSLSVPRALFTEPISAAVCSKAYFVGGGYMDLYTHTIGSELKIIDIYDVNTGTWSVDSMTEVKILHAVAGVDDHLIIAGGYDWNEISTMEIYIDPDCIFIGIDPPEIENPTFSIYPNPTSGNINLNLGDNNDNKKWFANIYNMQGQLVLTEIIQPDNREMNLQLPPGVYVLRVVAEDRVYSELITIQK
jgi:hypothetical protein